MSNETKESITMDITMSNDASVSHPNETDEKTSEGSSHELKPPKEKYVWTMTEFEMLRPTYYRLSVNSARLLEIAKHSKAKESMFHYLVVLFSLASSFLSALPGINETIRASFTAAFTLASALISGWMTKKAYGQKAGKYYSAYQEYKDLLILMDNVMVSLKSDRDYESFNFMISKVESKYEIFLPIDVIDVERIEKICWEKFHVLERRVEDAKREAIRVLHKKFIDRKSYVYLYESKLNMYRQYVFHETVKNHRDASKLLTCNEYEEWCRTQYPEKYREINRVYDRYVRRQIGRFYLPNGDFDGSKIELEMVMRPIFSQSEGEFYLTINDKFLALQRRIRERVYQESDEEPRADENFSLDA